MNFWHDLPKPIIGLSPMDGITDAPFRYITAKYGRPDVTITEFTHVQGLWVGKMEVWKDLLYNESERPVVAQLFGSDPDYFYKAAIICCELGFDGIDINMGCPANNVVKKGGGASLIAEPIKAQAIIIATKKGVEDWVNGQALENVGLSYDKLVYIAHQQKFHPLPKKRNAIPVSVKTRLGIEHNTVTEWVKKLLEVKPDAITIHGRTLKQLYSGEANWDAIGSVSELIRQSGTVYLGNGDISSPEQGRQKALEYSLDGVLIGRAAWGYPWIFNGSKPTIDTILNTIIEHSSVFIQLKGNTRFHEMKKHFGWYPKGFEGAKELRTELMKTQSIEEVYSIIQSFRTHHSYPSYS